MVPVVVDIYKYLYLRHCFLPLLLKNGTVCRPLLKDKSSVTVENAIIAIYLIHLAIAKVFEGSMLSKILYDAPIQYKLDQLTDIVYILHFLLDALDKPI